MEWPVVMNEKGLPDVNAPLNRHSQDAGGEHARLIRYKSRIYVQSRSSVGERDFPPRVAGTPEWREGNVLLYSCSVRGREGSSPTR